MRDGESTTFGNSRKRQKKGQYQEELPFRGEGTQLLPI